MIGTESSTGRLLYLRPRHAANCQRPCGEQNSIGSISGKVPGSRIPAALIDKEGWGTLTCRPLPGVRRPPDGFGRGFEVSCRAVPFGPRLGIPCLIGGCLDEWASFLRKSSLQPREPGGGANDYVTGIDWLAPVRHGLK